MASKATELPLRNGSEPEENVTKPLNRADEVDDVSPYLVFPNQDFGRCLDIYTHFSRYLDYDYVTDKNKHSYSKPCNHSSSHSSDPPMKMRHLNLAVTVVVPELLWWNSTSRNNSSGSWTLIYRAMGRGRRGSWRRCSRC